MGATTSNKKRKLQEINEAAIAAKKTKKNKSPAPPVEPPSEDEEDEEDVPSDEEGYDEGSEEKIGNGDAESDEDDKDAEEGDEIPTADAPLLPPTTTSDKFEDMNLSEKSMRAIKAMGFTTMTKIQRSVSILSQDHLSSRD